MMEDGDERFVCLDCGRRFPDVNKDMTKYPPHWIPLALGRGWDQEAHQQALDSGDWDKIAVTHPTNMLTEDEVYPDEQ